jgi:hypothetical protein
LPSLKIAWHICWKYISSHHLKKQGGFLRSSDLYSPAAELRLTFRVLATFFDGEKGKRSLPAAKKCG